MHIHLLRVQEVGSGLRAPEAKEDWEQLLGAVLGKAGSTGWGTGLLSSAGAMELCKHCFVRGPRQTYVQQHSQERGRQVVADLD